MSAEPLTFEKVWEMFQETDRKIQEADRKFQKSREESMEIDLKYQKSGEELREQLKETDRIVKELSKNIGGLNNSVGGLIETLIAARLWEKFGAYSLSRAYRRVPIYNEKNKAISDIDILLSNTEWVIAVEVKREVELYDINRHIKRMQWIRDYPPAETKGKKLLGAIAGGDVPPDIADIAHEKGFFVLELKGESTELISPPDFKPKIW